MALSDDPGLQAALAESRQQARDATASLRGLAAHLTALREELEDDEAFLEADAAARAQHERATPEH